MLDRIAWIALGVLIGMALCFWSEMELVRVVEVPGPESRGDAIAAETKGE